MEYGFTSIAVMTIFYNKGNSLLHIGMRDLNILHEYRVRNGTHEWSYWRTGLYDGLKFIGEKFHR